MFDQLLFTIARPNPVKTTRMMAIPYVYLLLFKRIPQSSRLKFTASKCVDCIWLWAAEANDLPAIHARHLNKFARTEILTDANVWVLIGRDVGPEIVELGGKHAGLHWTTT